MVTQLDSSIPQDLDRNFNNIVQLSKPITASLTVLSFKKDVSDVLLDACNPDEEVVMLMRMAKLV